jgi:hypothetical protein
MRAVLSTNNPFSFLVLIIVIAGVALLIVRVFQNRPGGPENSLRRSAVGEPILFEGRVWVRTVKAPWWMGGWMGRGGAALSRWNLAVRRGSIQLTSQAKGNFGPATKNNWFLRSDDVSMEMTRSGQRECIVLTGMSQNRPVEVWISADGQNQVVWSALARAGVHVAKR